MKKIDKYDRFGIFNKNGMDLRLLVKNKPVAPTPLPSAKEVDKYYRGLPDDITTEEYDQLIDEENNYFDNE